MSVYAGRITTGEFAPRDENGAPIPNTEFFLYLPGTTTPPTYYTNRVKGGTVSGPPATDSRGNVDPSVQWVDPGFYDYWYNGELIEEGVEVTEDNSEDDVALSAAIDEITNDLDNNYYTKTETDAIIAGTGEVTGAELQVNKGVAGGYAELTDPGGVVPDEQLPDSATTADRNPTAHASSHELGGDDEIAGSNMVIADDANFNADYGQTIYVPIELIDPLITLPTPVAGKPPVTVLAAPSSNALVSVTGTGLSDFTGSDPYQFGLYNGGGVQSVIFWCDDTTWYLAPLGIPYSEGVFITVAEKLLSSFLSNVKIPLTTFTDTEYPAVGEEIGEGIGAFTTIRCTNAGGCLINLGATTKVGESITVIQDSATQVQFVIPGGSTATKVEPDGYSKTRKRYAAMTATVWGNSDGSHAVWVITGDTGP